jgi:hypothetical protein
MLQSNVTFVQYQMRLPNESIIRLIASEQGILNQWWCLVRKRHEGTHVLELKSDVWHPLVCPERVFGLHR